MMMVEKFDLTNLSTEVIARISSFMMGEPEYLRLKHNEALKKIQRKYRTNINPEEIYKTPRYEEKTYTITRTIPFHIDRIKDVILNQKTNILEASNEGFEKCCIKMVVMIKYNNSNSIGRETWSIEDRYISLTNIDNDLNNIVKSHFSNIRFHENSIIFNNNMKILNVKSFSVMVSKKIKQPVKQYTEIKKKECNKVERKFCKIERPSNDYLKNASDFD